MKAAAARRRVIKKDRTKLVQSDPFPVLQYNSIGLAETAPQHVQDMRTRYLAYLKSEHWADLRKKALAYAAYKCQRCQVKDRPLDVHHLRYKNLYDVTLIDLAVLCRKCHDVVHQNINFLRRKFASSRSRCRRCR